MKLVIVIPAYNEEKAIGKVISGLPKKLPGVKSIAAVIVDDGSSDKTAAASRRAGAKLVLRHRINCGKGTATITGLAAARRLAADMVVTMDADGQHDPADIKKLIRPIIKKEAEVVIGSRLLNAKGMPLVKIIGNWLMNGLTFVFSGQLVSDSQSGMKALSRRALEKIKLDGSGYEIDSEIILETRRHNLKIIEIPIKVIYSDYSNLKGQNIFNAVNIFTRLLLRSLTK